MDTQICCFILPTTRPEAFLLQPVLILTTTYHIFPPLLFQAAELEIWAQVVSDSNSPFNNSVNKKTDSYSNLFYRIFKRYAFIICFKPHFRALKKNRLHGFGAALDDFFNKRILCIKCMLSKSNVHVLKFKYLIQYVILLFKENPRATVTLHFQFHAVKFFFVFLFSGINEEREVVKKDISTLTTPFILPDPHP